METTSKLWDLNYEAESLEKANFLTIRVHLTTLSGKMKRGLCILAAEIKGMIHQIVYLIPTLPTYALNINKIQDAQLQPTIPQN